MACTPSGSPALSWTGGGGLLREAKEGAPDLAPDEVARARPVGLAFTESDEQRQQWLKAIAEELEPNDFAAALHQRNPEQKPPCVSPLRNVVQGLESLLFGDIPD